MKPLKQRIEAGEFEESHDGTYTIATTYPDNGGYCIACGEQIDHSIEEEYYREGITLHQDDYFCTGDECGATYFTIWVIAEEEEES